MRSSASGRRQCAGGACFRVARGPRLAPLRSARVAGTGDVPPGGLPNADRVMEQGLVLPSSHALADEDVDYIWETAEAFLT